MCGQKQEKEFSLFEIIEEINRRPKPFEYYTANDLWTDEHTSKQMLSFHLDGDIDVSSRNTAFIDRSVEWIVSHFGIKAGTKIADFGCGPGLYTIRLARARADVTGIDFSRRSIEYAKDAAAKEGLHIRYENNDYREFTTNERFDLILMIMCDYCALDPIQRKDLLATFLGLLNPGGSILLDVYSLNAFDTREETSFYEVNLQNGFWSPGKYYGFLNVFTYEREKVVLDKYTIVEPNRMRVIYNWLQYFSRDGIEREFRESGLRIERVYSDVAGTPFNPDGGEFALVARRA